MPADLSTRPNYTARRREALWVARNAEGMLEIGKGRLRIAPGTVPYFRRVVAALGYVLDLPGGAEAMDQGDALGHPVAIMQPKVPTIPANAWTLPEDVGSGEATGCGSIIVFDPDDWPRQGEPASPSSHEVLLKLLLQANGYAAGVGTPPAVPEPAGARQGQLRLSCRPAKAGDVLSFPYIVENPGPDDVYVMDGVASAGDRPSVVIRPDGDAIVGTFIPPMPTDRQIAVPVLPLARRLSAGGVLEHRLEIAAPYAEASPWLPDPAPEQQAVTAIKGVVLAVGYWPVGMKELAVTEIADSPGRYAITPPSGGALVSLRFPTNGLCFARRADLVSRSL